MSRCSSRGRFAGALAWAAAVTLLSFGCQLVVNPFADELASQQKVTTPSAERARAATPAPSTLHRSHLVRKIRTHDGAVTHGPLYFEDPFEDHGSEDARSAWTGEDYLHLACGPGRYLLNGALFPVSAMVTPPWVVMTSDGRLSRQILGMDHDAERGH